MSYAELNSLLYLDLVENFFTFFTISNSNSNTQTQTQTQTQTVPDQTLNTQNISEHHLHDYIYIFFPESFSVYIFIYISENL